MKRTFHIISKDMRDLRLLLPLAGWWSIAILQVLLISIFPGLPSTPPAIEMMSAVLLAGLAWLLAALDFGLLVLIVSQLVQRDSTVGSTAFWLSRPVSGARLLAGKSLLLLLLVILPVLGAQVLLLLFNGTTLYDAFRSVPQIVVLQLLVISVLMMLACLTANLPRMLYLGIIAAVGLAIVQYTLRLPSPDRWDRWDSSLYDSAAIGFSLFLLAVAVTVVCHQYLTRRTKRSLILASSVVPGLLLFMSLWPWDFWTTEAPVAPAILDPEQVAARVEVESLKFHRRANRDGDDWLILRGDLAVDSLPAGLVAIAARISAEQVLPSGKALAHHRWRSSRFVPRPVPTISVLFRREFGLGPGGTAGRIAGRSEDPQHVCSILATFRWSCLRSVGNTTTSMPVPPQFTRPMWNSLCNETACKPCGRSRASAMSEDPITVASWR